MIRKIVVPVRGDGKGDNVLAHAAALAHRFNAHIEVAHCRPMAEDLLPFGIPMPKFAREQLMKQAKDVADIEEEGLRDELHALALDLGLRETNEPDFSQPSVSFAEEAGKMAAVIKHHGRLADIIAVAQPDPETNLGQNSLKSALFQTGRPVLMCPNGAARPQSIGAHVAVAWNGSLEASRAVALTLPIIEAASAVTVLCGGANAGNGAETDDLIEYLKLRQIEADRITFDPKKGVARTLLDSSAEVGADMMIMGAYGDSHEREYLFGGNTQTVVEKAQLPVMMVH